MLSLFSRKARKLGLAELAILLLVILTIGHFLVIWSMYLERKFELVCELFMTFFFVSNGCSGVLA